MAYVPSCGPVLDSDSLVDANWYVDSVNGDDRNSGTTPSKPLKTCYELGKRINFRPLSPSVLSMNVYLAAGTYVDVVLYPFLPLKEQTFTLQGTMQTDLAGSVNAFTSWNAAGGIRAALQVLGADFTSLKRKRLRLTSGANVGALGSFGSIAAANTCQPTSFGTATSAAINPVAGDGVAVETPLSACQGLIVEGLGQGLFILRDLLYDAVNSDCRFRARAASPTRMRAQGIEFRAFSTSTPPNITGSFFAIGCYVTGPIGLAVATEGNSTWLCTGFYHDSISQFNNQGYYLANNWLADGDGTNDARLVVGNGALLESIGTQSGIGCFGCVGGANLVEVNDGSMVIMSLANSLFWGAAGNTSTVALRVFNGCGFEYVTRPTATGAAPGVNDVTLANAAAVAWAAIPAIAAAPNNAYVNVRQ